MTYSDTQPRGTLRYRMLASSMSPNVSEIGSWGHEYIRHLAAELGEEYKLRVEGEGEEDATADGTTEEKLDVSIDELRSLAMECAKFLLAHNAEPDAVDLLDELEIAERLAEVVDENTYARVCAYMLRYVNQADSPPRNLN